VAFSRLYIDGVQCFGAMEVKYVGRSTRRELSQAVTRSEISALYEDWLTIPSKKILKLTLLWSHLELL